MNKSLARLGTDYVDLLQVVRQHPDPWLRLAGSSARSTPVKPHAAVPRLCSHACRHAAIAHVCWLLQHDELGNVINDTWAAR